MFLNVEAIPGESTNAYLRDNINLTSYAHSILGCDFAVAGGGSCSSDAKDMVVTFKLDKSIVELKRRVSTGEPIKNIVLTGALASSTFRPRYKVYLQSAWVTSVTEATNSSNELIFQVTFSAERVGWEYIPIGRDGSPLPALKSGYDFKNRVIWTSF